MLDGLRNWWAAEPWRVWPWSAEGWRYRNIYRSYRRGSWDARRGRWLAGGEPRGLVEALWRTVCFPHVHEEDEFAPDWTVPPGDTLLELMSEHWMTFSELARLMGEDETRVQKILAGVEPVTAADAWAFEEIFGVSVAFWLNMEHRYREDLARGAARVV